MNLFADAMADLSEILTEQASVPITYTRESTSIACTGVRSNHVDNSIDDEGVIHRSVSRDYLIPDAVFPFTERPRDGDMITDDGKTYLVQSMPGESPWRWSDPYQRVLRIHTKQIRIAV